MTTENEFINKSYYLSMIDNHNQGHPVKILGEMYIEEMQKQRPHLSSIRFAQGEIYFLHNDYEAAIFKWQQPLEKELIPWAQKNIADAHLEMGLLEDAEGFYKQVETSSLALKSEVLLQLFTLYVQQGNQGKAVNTIKNAVRLNPDYPRVTEIARTYLEDIRDWDHAVELAVDEALRTKSLSWFDVLSGYVEKGLTLNNEPVYFNTLLATLIQMDYTRFERFAEVLWNSYKQSDVYIEWLEEINQLLLDYHDESSYVWKRLPGLYHDAYFELISGQFLIRDISYLMQSYLTNWLYVSSGSDSLISSTAILAWNETFHAMLDPELVRRAEYQFEHSKPNQNGRKDGIELFDSIKRWAEEEGLSEDLTEMTKPMLDEYHIEAASPSRLQELVKVSIAFLLEQRVQVENAVQEDIKWNEGLLTSLHDIHHQIGDMEIEMADNITASFRNIKNAIIQHVMSELPKQLQNCSEFIQEDSHFQTLHVELNEEMNKRIAVYMRNYVKHELKDTVQQWIEGCKNEFHDSQMICHEFSENINQQFNEKKIVLQGDFKVLNDWQRDLERIARGLQRHKKVNILMRNTPAQLLLKGAGKLLGSISKNNDMLHSKYKDYIKNADFSQEVKDIMTPFMQQLDLFEESIEWDVSRFLSDSLDVLNREMEEAQLDIERHKDALHKMQENPEIYSDPLTLFNLKLRQYELMHTINQEV